MHFQVGEPWGTGWGTSKRVFTLFPYINVGKIYENHHFAHISPQNSHLNVILTLTTNFMAKYKPLGTYYTKFQK